MSKPSSSLALNQLPAPLESSKLLTLFVRLASITHQDIEHWISTSNLNKLAKPLSQAFVNPIRSRLKDFPWLHQGLAGLHLLSTLSIFLLATFASTGLIGATVIISLILLILRSITTPLSLKFTIVDGLVLLFFVIALIATLFSSYMHTSLAGLGKFSVFLAGFLNFRVLIGNNPRTLIWMLGVLLLLGFGESLIGLYQYMNHIQPLATWQDTSLNPEDQLTRIFGTLKPSNPNLLAGFLIPCVAAGIGLTLRMLFTGRFGATIPLAGMTGITFIALVLTGSRGGYLAIAAMGVLTFLYLGHLLWHEPQFKDRYKLKAFWLLVGVGSILVAAATLFLLPALKTRLFSIFAMREDSSNSYRMNVWMSTLHMIRDNWLLGIGPGNDTFKQVYGLYMIPGYNALSAYSIFLEIWAEQGILGLITFTLLLVTVALRTCMAFYTSMPTEQKVLIGLLFTGIIGSVVYGLFDTIWYRPSVNLLFWLFVAGISVYTELAFAKTSSRTGSRECSLP